MIPRFVQYARSHRLRRFSIHFQLVLCLLFRVLLRTLYAGKSYNRQYCISSSRFIFELFSKVDQDWQVFFINFSSQHLQNKKYKFKHKTPADNCPPPLLLKRYLGFLFIIQLQGKHVLSVGTGNTYLNISSIADSCTKYLGPENICKYNTYLFQIPDIRKKGFPLHPFFVFIITGIFLII